AAAIRVAASWYGCRHPEISNVVTSAAMTERVMPRLSQNAGGAVLFTGEPAAGDRPTQADRGPGALSVPPAEGGTQGCRRRDRGRAAAGAGEAEVPAAR